MRSVESLRPGVDVALEGGGLQGRASAWREQVEAEAGTGVLARFEDGTPAILRRGRVRYLAGTLDQALLDTVIEGAAKDAGLATTRLPEGLRLRRRGRVRFAFHSGPGRVAVPAPAGATWLLGERELGPAGVAAWLAD